jgi:hypothetical protein
MGFSTYEVPIQTPGENAARRYDSFSQNVRQPRAKKRQAAPPRRLNTLRAARLRPSDCAVPLVSGVLLVMKIVDVFVRDTLKGSYPVVVECQGRPAEDEFVDQVRNGMDRGFYSADDIKVAKFVVREAGERKQV